MDKDVFQQTGYCIKHDRDMYFNILTNEFECNKCIEEIWYDPMF